MPRAQTSCDDCGRPVVCSVTEHASPANDFTLTWSLGYRCDHCGCAIEADDLGPIAGEWREAVLAAEGLWSLQVGPCNKRALREMRAILGLTMSELGELKRALPAQIRTGTRTEMQRLAKLLVKAGQPAEAVCSGSFRGSPA